MGEHVPMDPAEKVLRPECENFDFLRITNSRTDGGNGLKAG